MSYYMLMGEPQQSFLHQKLHVDAFKLPAHTHNRSKHQNLRILLFLGTAQYTHNIELHIAPRG